MGLQVAVVAAERPPPPNKAISQSPSHPAPPLPASLFPPFQTSDHSSLCLTNPERSSTGLTKKNAPSAAQPITAGFQTSSAKGRRGCRGGLAWEEPSWLCTCAMNFTWKVICAFIYFGIWDWPFSRTQKLNLLFFFFLQLGELQIRKQFWVWALLY